MNILKHLTNKKYRYFMKKLEGVEKMILDLEFKRFKTREIREDVRVEFDQLNSKLSVLVAQIASQKETPTMEAGDIARLDDQKTLLERDIERLKNQITMLDIEVEGAKPSNEMPEGFQGVNQQLDALHELVGMLKDYAHRV